MSKRTLCAMVFFMALGCCTAMEIWAEGAGLCWLLALFSLWGLHDCSEKEDKNGR
jgi:hypothetical protein